MTRRSFVAASGGAAVGVIAGLPNVRASDKTGRQTPVVGAGEYQYERIHDWGRLPAGIAYGNTHGLEVDSRGLRKLA